MSRIAKLLAAQLSDDEQDALRCHGLGRGEVDCPSADCLIRLRLVEAHTTTRQVQITRLGKEVLGEIILTRYQPMRDFVDTIHAA